MTSSKAALAAVLFLTLTSACKVAESGNIPCNDDSNCPKDYPQCIVATGKCTEAVVGTPGLAANTITVAPAAITGGQRPAITLALPALSGNASLARKVTLGISSGGTSEPVVKSGGAAVGLADLGTTITVDAPATTAADEKTYTYTLTVSNDPSSTAAVTATGTLGIVPAPVLASDTFVITPATITGGLTPTLSIALPALSSVPASVATVSFTISGCGSGGVTKTSGDPVGLADLGTTISIAPPASGAADSKTCIYTLSVANSATTPASVSAAGSLVIAPLPVISSSTFAIAPGAITGGLTPTLSTTLPSLTSPAAPGTQVSFTISGTGCGSGPVAKTNGGGGAVLLTDLGKSISFASPASISTDNKVCTYTLVVSNTTTTASATGTLAIVPVPVLAGSSFSIADPIITGGTAAALSLTLPGLTSAVASAATVTLSTSDCGGAVTKVGGAGLTAADLGQPISIPSPATAASDPAKTCHYTLTVSNAAATATTGFVQANGSLAVVPAPTLAAVPVAFTPGAVTGGFSSTVSVVLPSTNLLAAQTSSVQFTVSGTGCGASTVTKHGGGSVGFSDLGNAGGFLIDVASSSTSTTRDCTYQIEIFNTATSAAHAGATGVFHIMPTPSLTGAVSFSPAIVTGGFNSTVNLSLPLINLTAAEVSFVQVVVSGGGCGSGAITKHDTTAIGFSDLGGSAFAIDVAGSISSTARDCTYTLTVKNAADSPAQTTAAGTFHIVPTPVLTPTGAGNLTFTPAIATGGFTSFKINMPAVNLTSTQVSAVTVSVSGTGCGTTVTRSGVGGFAFADLNKALTVDAPTPNTGVTLDCTYTVDVANTATTAAHDSVNGVFHVVPATVLTPTGTDALTFTPAIATGGSLGSTFQIHLPSVNLTSTQATNIQLTVSGAGCNPGTVTKSGGGSIGFADLGQAVTLDSPTNTTSTTLDCAYSLSVDNTGSPVSTATATGTFHIIPHPLLSPTGAGGITFVPATATGGFSTFTIVLPAVNLTSGQTGQVNVSVSGAGCGTTVSKSPGNSTTFGFADLGTSVVINAPTNDSTTTLDCTYSVDVFNDASTPVKDTASGVFHIVPAPVIAPHTGLVLSPASITGGSSPDISLLLPSATNATSATLTVSGPGVCGTNVTVNKTGGGSGGTGAIVLADLGAAAIVFKPPVSTTADSAVCTYTLTALNSASPTPGTDTVTGTLTIVGAPAFAGSLTVTPNVLADGPATTGLLAFALPTASNSPTAIAMTVTPAGGATTAVTKTGALPSPQPISATPSMSIPLARAARRRCTRTR